MKKKIVASVAALILVAAALPANKLSEIFPSSSGSLVITASAASSEIDIDGYHVKISEYTDPESVKHKRVELYSKFTDHTVSNLSISLSDAQYNEIVAALDDGASLNDYRFAFMGNWDVEKNRAESMNTFQALAKVTFTSDRINMVGDGAFSSCPKLTTVDLGSNIKVIGRNAFANCPLFVGGDNNRLDVSNVEEIDDSAFNNDKFTEIKFGENLTRIGSNAFSRCEMLTKVNLPSSLIKLRGNAFSGCKSMSSVTFGANPQIILIGGSAFADCSMLTSVTVSGAGSENTLPADTLGVYGDSIFANCTSLQSFLWPAQSRFLPAGTFSGCTKLNKVYFGDKDANTSIVQWIGDGAFQGCVNLNEITLPESATIIAQKAFSGCETLKTVVVSDHLAYISGRQNYTNAPVEEFGPGVSYVSIVQDMNTNYATYGDRYEHILGSTFYNCKQLSLYPRSKMSQGSSYRNKVELPDTLMSIPTGCFENCTGITSVTIPNVQSIGQRAFKSCAKLGSVKIPDYTVKASDNNYTFINNETFSGCTSLKDVEIPDNLRYIRDSAFEGCTSLETMTPASKSKIAKTIQIPDATTSIMRRAFFNCPSFQYLNFSTASELGALGSDAFNGCKSLVGSNLGSSSNNTISVPSGVVYIEPNLFANCTALDKITFLGNVTFVGENAFLSCSSLEQVIMNDTIKAVDKGAFSKCTSLKQMPQTLDGKPALVNLEVINANTFSDCTSLESAYISKNITQIFDNAFFKCENLKNVQWEDGSTLYNIGNNAFSNCTSLELISSGTSGTLSTFPESLEGIGNNSFQKTGLVNVKIGKPSSGELMFIGTGAFANSEKLEKMDLSDSNLSSIPSSSCQGCTALKTVVLPESTVTTIGDGAFNNCYYLHTFGDKNTPNGEYVLPESINTINGKAFENNYCMQKITFPSGITQINLSMFNIHINEKDIKDKGYTPIEEIKVSSDNEFYSSENGVLYNKDKTSLLCYPLAKKGDKFTIPDSVKVLTESALAANSNLKEITINPGLTEIKSRAFYDDHNLNSIDFGKNSSVVIARDAFGGHNDKVTLYGASGSTSETAATSDARALVFVDNAKAAATIKLLDQTGSIITSDAFKVSFMKHSYQFGVVQKDKSGAVSMDTLKWSVDKNDIATVNNMGQLTFTKEGTVVMTVQNAAGTAATKLKVQIVNEDIVEFKRGDVDSNKSIDIEDAVAIIGHVNGVKALEGASAKAADVDGNNAIDIEDAVMVINHINGVKAID